MRLFRRSLLCLVVGVTAFGVAGWAFRPRPRWQVRLPSAKIDYELVGHSMLGLNNEAIWIRAGEHDEDYNDLTRFLAFDPLSGEQLRAVRQPSEWREDPIPFGDKLFLIRSAKENEEGTGTQFWMYDAKVGGDPILRSFPGEWSLDEDGLYAWNVDTTDNETMVLKRRRLSDGEERPTVQFPGRYGNLERQKLEYSSDSKRLAVAQSLRLDDPHPLAVDVFDAETGKLLDTAVPAMTRVDDKTSISGVHFQDRGRLLSFWPVDSPLTPSWFYSLDKRAFITTNLPSPPPGAQLKDDFHERMDDDFSALTALRFAPNRAWVALNGSKDVEVEWRALPYAIVVDYFVNHQHGVSVKTDRLIGATAEIVPRTSQLLVETTEPSMAAAVPESFRGWMPSAWMTGDVETRFRWHDWHSGVWRDVGCRNAGKRQIRQRELITITPIDDDESLLECWPLPPRDPKWPALGVAAFFTAATWWVCAKRYARKLRSVA